MQNKIFAVFFYFTLLGNVFSSERDLLKSVQLTNSVQEILKTNFSAQKYGTCSAVTYKNKICPVILIDEVLDNNKKGIVGTINKMDNALTDSGDFSTPNNVCKNALIAPKPLAKDLELAFQEHTFDCRTELEKNNIKGFDYLRAEDYINSFLLEKKNQVEANMLSLLSVSHQIDQLLGPGETSISCHQFTSDNVHEACKKSQSCSAPMASLFEQKLTSVFDTVELVRRLRLEMRSSPHRKELSHAVDALLEANPMLKSRAFEPLFMNMDRPLDRVNVERAYKKELKRTRIIAIDNLKKNNRAHLCMTGKSLDCEDFSEVVRTPFDKSNATARNISDSYRCLENAKESRNEANKVLNDVALSAALSFTPMAALQMGKALYQGGNLIKTAARLEDAKKKIIIGGLAFDGAFAGNEILKVQKSCEDKLKNLEQPSPEFSCEQQTAQIKLQIDASECTSQILTAGLSSLAPALGALTMSASKNVPAKLTALLKGENDHELTSLLENFVKDIPDVTARQTKLKDLETKAVSLLNSSEGYSREEVKYGLKVLIKRCLGK